MGDGHLSWLAVAAVAAARELSPPEVARLVRGRAQSGTQGAAGLVASGAWRVDSPGLLAAAGLSRPASRGLSRCET